MTRPDGGRSCPDVWPWSDDESLGRHQECRRRSHHGRQRRRGAPVRLQVGDRGQGAQQGAAHRRRSALHPLGLGRRLLRADPHRHRHRLPRRRDQLPAGQRQDPARVRQELHRLHLHRARGLRVRTTACIPATTPTSTATTRRAGTTRSAPTATSRSTRRSRIRAASTS